MFDCLVYLGSITSSLQSWPLTFSVIWVGIICWRKRKGKKDCSHERKEKIERRRTGNWFHTKFLMRKRKEKERKKNMEDCLHGRKSKKKEWRRTIRLIPFQIPDAGGHFGVLWRRRNGRTKIKSKPNRTPPPKIKLPCAQPPTRHRLTRRTCYRRHPSCLPNWRGCIKILGAWIKIGMAGSRTQATESNQALPLPSPSWPWAPMEMERTEAKQRGVRWAPSISLLLLLLPHLLRRCHHSPQHPSLPAGPLLFLSRHQPCGGASHWGLTAVQAGELRYGEEHLRWADGQERLVGKQGGEQTSGRS